MKEGPDFERGQGLFFWPQTEELHVHPSIHPSKPIYPTHVHPAHPVEGYGSQARFARLGDPQTSSEGEGPKSFFLFFFYPFKREQPCPAEPQTSILTEISSISETERLGRNMGGGGWGAMWMGGWVDGWLHNSTAGRRPARGLTPGGFPSAP